MIETTVYFEKVVDLDTLVETLKTLPAVIRPVYYTKDEGKINKANRLDDEARFRAFLKANPSGFFLYTEDRTCIDITATSAAGVHYSDVTLWLAEGLSNELATTFLKHLAIHKPAFGFACDYQIPVPDTNGSYVIGQRGVPSEYHHRNRFYITLGKNNIEDWIGRKLDKFIPGVYWLTLLSDGLLAKHDVKLAVFESEAVSTESLGDGSLHLLKFFETPKEWKENAERLDDLCERVEGVFSRRSVEAAVAGVTNYLEYDVTITNWR